MVDEFDSAGCKQGRASRTMMMGNKTATSPDRPESTTLVDWPRAEQTSDLWPPTDVWPSKVGRLRGICHRFDPLWAQTATTTATTRTATTTTTSTTTTSTANERDELAGRHRESFIQFADCFAWPPAGTVGAPHRPPSRVRLIDRGRCLRVTQLAAPEAELAGCCWWRRPTTGPKLK